MSRSKLIRNEATRALLSPLTNGVASQHIKPTIATVYLTKSCNSQCNFCDFWKNDKDPNELTSEQWGVVFSRLKAFGVGFMGVNASGEMFFRQDALKILQHLRNIDMPFGINSNGLLLHGKRAKQLAELQPRQVTIGMDGYGDESYLETRGVKNGFTKVCKNIKEMQTLGLDSIGFGSVMMIENMNDWVKLAEYALEQGLSGIRFTAFHDNYFNPQSQPTGSRYAQPVIQERVSTEIEKLIELKRETGIVKNSEAYLHQVIEFYKDQENYFPTPCLQGSNRIEVDIYGNVTLCSFVTDPLGNLVTQDMDEIWNSELHKKARDDAYYGRCPKCFLSCYGEENIRLSSSGFLPTLKDTLKRRNKLLSLG